MSDRLTHVGDSGEAKMVDVSAKDETKRVAKATGMIRMKLATLSAIVNAQIKKGDVLGTARIAAVMAAKKTSDLIPLCHPIALTDVQVESEDARAGRREVLSCRETDAGTGPGDDGGEAD